jgi:hypothetical protein
MTCIEDPYEESSFISKGILEVDYADEYGERRCTVRFVSETMEWIYTDVHYV